MANILAVGIATLDIINQVQDYPLEDEELRAVSQQRSRGGNATNSLAILSQLGHQCDWAGTLAQETDTKLIIDDLEKYNIDYSWVDILPNGKIPTSYITLSQSSGSRTIVHYRDLPEYSAESFRKIPLDKYDWIHFEGRNIDQLRFMLQHCKHQYPHIRISLEIEKQRPKIESLYHFPDLLLFSKPFAESMGESPGDKFLQRITTELKTQFPAPPKKQILSCTWGKTGAYLKRHNELLFSHAPQLPNAIYTLAAGDTYNAALIHNLLQQNTMQHCLDQACFLAAQKCTHTGLDFISADV